MRVWEGVLHSSISIVRKLHVDRHADTRSDRRAVKMFQGSTCQVDLQLFTWSAITQQPQTSTM